jgi:cytochrome c biogenesis protein CcdA
MSDLWLILLPILLTDVANPVLLALVVYLAGAPRGILLASAALTGHTAAYFASGVLIALGFERLTAFVADPGPISYSLGLLLGLLLLWAAWKSRAQDPQNPPPEDPPATLGSAFTTGAIINFIGIPFALPYFAAIDQILKAQLEVSGSLLLLAGYNLAYLLPFTMVPLATLIMGVQARAPLERLNQWVERVAAVLLPFILGAVGLALIVDALLYFFTGTGLF